MGEAHVGLPDLEAGHMLKRLATLAERHSGSDTLASHTGFKATTSVEVA